MVQPQCDQSAQECLLIECIIKVIKFTLRLFKLSYVHVNDIEQKKARSGAVERIVNPTLVSIPLINACSSSFSVAGRTSITYPLLACCLLRTIMVLGVLSLLVTMILFKMYDLSAF